ncbi:hypothetical protein J3E69DRAFT_337248 [Trichoderma sp. SZMC 28015]
MCDITKSYDYVRARTAKTASAHKLYKQTMNALKNQGRRVENLSWPIYLILSAVYKKLSKRYIKLVRRLYGSSTIGDYSNTYRTLLRGSDSSPSANAANSSQNPFAPAASTAFAAPAGLTMFSSSKNAPAASTNSFSSAVNAPSSFARRLVPKNASDQSKDTVLAAANKTVAEAKAYMAAQKAMEDQRMSGPAPRDDE